MLCERSSRISGAGSAACRWSVRSDLSASYCALVSSNAASWYSDPTGKAELRYWDGESWTEHVSTNGVQGKDPWTGAATEQILGADTGTTAAAGAAEANQVDPGEEHVRNGGALEQCGDIAGAEAAYALADQAGSASGALYLGVLLGRRGDVDGARAAYARGEERGDPRASCNLGFLLEDLGDVEGAKAAYGRALAVGFSGGAYELGRLLFSLGDIEGSLAANRKADELGDPDGSFNLGILLREQGDFVGAEAAFARADQRGAPHGSTALGKILRDRGDLEGAEQAFRRGDGGGDPGGSFDLGALLYEVGRLAEALDAMQRAADRGYEGAEEVAEGIRSEISKQSGVNLQASAAWESLSEALVGIGARRVSDTALIKEIPRGIQGELRRSGSGTKSLLLTTRSWKSRARLLARERLMLRPSSAR